MTAIYSNELQAAYNYSTLANLSTDQAESKNMNTLLTEFMSEGSLQGDAWKSVQAKLSEYSNVLNQRFTVAQSLSEAISKALGILIDYIEEYPYLDYDELKDIKIAREESLSKIEEIRGQLDAKEYVVIKKAENEGEEDTWGYAYVVKEPQRTYLEERINEIEVEILKIDKLIEKLEGLEAVYNEAESILEAAFAEVDRFGTAVAQITPSSPVQYVPVS